MAILALEASTSSAKAMLFDEHKGIIGIETEEYAEDIATPGAIDPEGAIKTVLACASKLIQHHRKIQIEAIGLCSVWHSLLLLDEDCKPVGPVWTWEGKKPGDIWDDFKPDALQSYRFYKTTGCPLSTTYDLWKWMQLKQTEDLTNVKYLSNLPGYLFYRLTGKRLTSSITASGSGMMALTTLTWDDEILHFAGLKPEMLPEIVPPEKTLELNAEAAKLLKLPSGIPVTTANADGALNHIAAGGLGKKVMTLSVGTSGAVRYALEHPLIPPKPTTFCYYGGEGMYILGASIAGAGNCVKWLTRRIFGGKYDFDTLEQLASRVKQDAPYFLPFLFGERAPGWSDGRRGGFFNLTGMHGAGEMYYAVLEGILFNLYQNYKNLKQFDLVQPATISMSGGITNSSFWMQLAADILGVPLTEDTGEHASLLGAAYMAQYATGKRGTLKDITPTEGKVYLPGPGSHTILMERYDQWLKRYEEG